MKNTHTRPKIDQQILVDHSQVSPWKSLTLIIAIYLGIALILAINHGFDSIMFTLLGFVIISGLQVHLTILMHEGAHLLLHPNAAINGILNELCAFPLLSFGKVYRAFHLQHHRYSGAVRRDPEVLMYHQTGFDYGPLTKRQLAKLFLKDLSGVHMLRLFRILNSTFSQLLSEGKAKRLTMAEFVTFGLFWGSILLIVHVLGFWQDFLVLWVLPLTTTSFFLLRMHGYGEHTGVKGQSEFERTFVHEFHPVTNFFFYPIKSGYHLEHHLFPTVPWYRMESFRRHLANDPEYRRRSAPVTLDGVFFGTKTILNQMLLNRETRNLGHEAGDLIGVDTQREINHQIETSL